MLIARIAFSWKFVAAVQVIRTAGDTAEECFGDRRDATMLLQLQLNVSNDSLAYLAENSATSILQHSKIRTLATGDQSSSDRAQDSGTDTLHEIPALAQLREVVSGGSALTEELELIAFMALLVLTCLGFCYCCCTLSRSFEYIAAALFPEAQYVRGLRLDERIANLKLAGGITGDQSASSHSSSAPAYSNRRRYELKRDPNITEAVGMVKNKWMVLYDSGPMGAKYVAFDDKDKAWKFFQDQHHPTTTRLIYDPDLREVGRRGNAYAADTLRLLSRPAHPHPIVDEFAVVVTTKSSVSYYSFTEQQDAEAFAKTFQMLPKQVVRPVGQGHEIIRAQKKWWDLRC